jgi:hypothetical protein
MKDKIFLWFVVVLLLVVILQLIKVHSKLDTIDWDTRQILGRIAR